MYVVGLRLGKSFFGSLSICNNDEDSVTPTTSNEYG